MVFFKNKYMAKQLKLVFLDSHGVWYVSITIAIAAEHACREIKHSCVLVALSSSSIMDRLAPRGEEAGAVRGPPGGETETHIRTALSQRWTRRDHRVDTGVLVLQSGSDFRLLIRI